ncbi:MAG TPA: hypothetical protein VH917_05765, partial [Ignavibacteriaceae bacterium]
GKGEVSFYAFHSVDHQKAFSVNVKVNSTDLDFYCFTKYSENIWTIESVKRFLFPKFIYIAADSLRSLTTLTSADSSMLKLLNLMTASDDLLKEYLNENLNKFEQLLKYFNQNDKDSIKILIDELSLNGIFKDNKYPGCIFIQIGEMQAREVGYIVNIDGAKLPEISPEDFVYVELIIPGWYLYRLM